MKENIIKMIVSIVIAIVAILFGLWLTKSIAESDIPMWLKFVLLR